MPQAQSGRIIATVAMMASVLTLSSASALARAPANHSAAKRAVVGAYGQEVLGFLSPSDIGSDECGPPGALPGIFRCESQKTEVDGDLYYNLDFINQFRSRFPYTTLDNNQIADWGHYVCKDLEKNVESAVVQAWVNAGWNWNDATWVVGTSENFFCPSLRGGDVVIPGA
ncbi:DUF732 domain-containing protein [Streptomyces sp. H27-H5]|uniref:DUF732 domain-containing protein n=1 Tax=Streptomyces sp. H27-H5 TaxID=2996460 RepID=UPI0022717AF6|nr:DUF732 domain-containing protein [Streptomyces sp. H27-H5]MCY0962332.1 DUF732 domain-containing protein [Streptomyces sp. H27-H5]